MNFKKHHDADINLQSLEHVDKETESELQVPPIDIENPPNNSSPISPISITRQHIWTNVLSKWYKIQPKIWVTLEEPNSSALAQVIRLVVTRPICYNFFIFSWCPL